MKAKLEGALMSLCPSTIGTGARTARPTGTREAPLDAPERRRDNGADRRVISTSQNVKRAAACTLAKINGKKLQVKAIGARQRNSGVDSRYGRERAFGVALAEVCKVHVSETGFFFVGYSWTSKF